MHIKLDEDKKVKSFMNGEEAEVYQRKKRDNPHIIHTVGDKVPSIGAKYDEESGEFSSYSRDYSRRGKKRKELKDIVDLYYKDRTKPVDMINPYYDTSDEDSIEESDFYDEEKEYSKGDVVEFADMKYLDWMEGANVNQILIDRDFYHTSNQSLKIINRSQECGGLDIPYEDLNMTVGKRYKVCVTYSPGDENIYEEDEWKDGMQQCFIICSKGAMFDFDYNDTYCPNIYQAYVKAGSWSDIEFELDFTDIDEITGVMRIQTVDGIPLSDFYIDRIQIGDAETKELIYEQTFEILTYEAKKRTIGKDPVSHPDVWKQIQK